jgi:hypothetical protein
MTPTENQIGLLRIVLVSSFLFVVTSCAHTQYHTLRLTGQFPAHSTGAKNQLSVSNSKSGFLSTSQFRYFGVLIELGLTSDLNDAPLVVLRSTDPRQLFTIPLLAQGKRKGFLEPNSSEQKVAFAFYGPIHMDIKKFDELKIEIFRSEKANAFPMFYNIVGDYIESDAFLYSLGLGRHCD